MIEGGFHLRGEVSAHDLGERDHQEAVHQDAELGRPEARFFLLDVATVDDRRHDRGVGRRAADALLFELLHEGCLGEPRRGLREVLLGPDALDLDRIADLDRGQQLVGSVRGFGLGVVGLGDLVHLGVARELHDLTVRANLRVAAIHIDRGLVVDRRHHLRGDETLPDQGVELRELGAFGMCSEGRRDAIRGPLHQRRADRFVGVLCALPVAVGVRLGWQVLCAVRRRDVLAQCGHRVVGDTRRIGTHIGDEAGRTFIAELDTFVEPLRECHRALRGVTMLARGILLQAARDEWCLRLLAALLLLDRCDDRVARGELDRDLVSLLLGLGFGALAFPLPDPGLEGRRIGRGDREIDRPVLLGDERLDLFFAFTHQANRDRLHATRRQATLDLVPQDRADLVTDEAIQDPARLLRVRLVHIDRAGCGDRGGDALLRDLVDEDAMEVRVLTLDLFGDVPCDRFTFAIRIGCEEHGLDLARGLTNLREHLLLALDHLVDRFERAVLEVDADLRFRQITHVTDRRLHDVVTAEVLVDRLGLRRRFHDHERGARLHLLGLARDDGLLLFFGLDFFGRFALLAFDGLGCRLGRHSFALRFLVGRRLPIGPCFRLDLCLGRHLLRGARLGLLDRRCGLGRLRLLERFGGLVLHALGWLFLVFAHDNLANARKTTRTGRRVKVTIASVLRAP